MLRTVRIFILSCILIFVALSTWLDRVHTTDWDGPLLIALYPINADNSAVTADYVTSLSQQQFAALEPFFDQQAQLYGVALERPLRFVLAAPLTKKPPLIPAQPNVLQIMWWSLKLRFWSWGIENPPGPTPTIRIFLLYYDAAHATRLPHSTGLQNGLLGIAHLFAERKMTGANAMVIAHELLHTLGATDKYDLATDQPLFPDGFADPHATPLYPQQEAELMAGRIPLSENEADIPRSLTEVMIGAKTAHEIGWIERSLNESQ